MLRSFLTPLIVLIGSMTAAATDPISTNLPLMANYAAPITSPAPSPQTSPDLAATWGIQVKNLRLSAGGHMIDFRYHVLDPDKAEPLGNHEFKPCLVDQATGRKLFVPSAPKTGALRQTAQKPTAGKTYFMLFSNRGKMVKAGNKVTIIIGPFRAENLLVEE